MFRTFDGSKSLLNPLALTSERLRQVVAAKEPDIERLERMWF